MTTTKKPTRPVCSLCGAKDTALTQLTWDLIPTIILNAALQAGINLPPTFVCDDAQECLHRRIDQHR